MVDVLLTCQLVIPPQENAFFKIPRRINSVSWSAKVWPLVIAPPVLPALMSHLLLESEFACSQVE
jgi:hypothetical protein